LAGVSYNQPEQEYRRNPAHAQSHVKHILKSPAHYQAALKQAWSPTLTMHVGSAVHCLVLEGQREFDSRFVLKPEGLSLTTKAGKEWKA
jgi:exodeoxyribonuclease VIII